MVITAKFAGRCHKCGRYYEKGENIAWDPDSQVKGGAHLKCPPAGVRDTMPTPPSMRPQTPAMRLPWPTAPNREAAMLSAGRLTVTLRTQQERHITIALNCHGPRGEQCDLAAASGIAVSVKSKKITDLSIGQAGWLTYDAESAGYILMGALSVLFQFLHDGTVPEGFEIKSHDLCGRCGEPLLDPESKKTGLGPNCRPKARRVGGTLEDLFDD